MRASHLDFGAGCLALTIVTCHKYVNEIEIMQIPQKQLLLWSQMSNNIHLLIPIPSLTPGNTR